MVMIKHMFIGKLGVTRVVTSNHGFTRAFSIKVFVTRNVVPTVILLFYGLPKSTDECKEESSSPKPSFE